MDEGPIPVTWGLRDCHCSVLAIRYYAVIMGGRNFQCYICKTKITQLLEIMFLIIPLNQLTGNLRNVKR